MPEDWKEGAIEQVAVGDNSVSVFYEKQDGVVYLKVEQDNPDWLIEVVFPASKDGLAAKVLNSTSKPIVSAGEVILSAKGTLYEAKVQYE